MAKRWARTLLTLALAAALGAWLLWNREPTGAKSQGRGTPTGFTAPPPSAWTNPPRGNPAALAGPMMRERPIGRDQARNHLRIAALWHRAVPLAGAPKPKPGDIHLLARIDATEGNPNGFARGDWVPYLTIRYVLTPRSGGPAAQGTLRPLLAADGPRYGVNLPAPPPGEYDLTFRLAPPSSETLGRFADATDGVADWWEPFEVTFAWPFRREP